MKMMSKSAMALAAGLLCACDDAGPSPVPVRITFTAPTVGALLTCADDEDRSTNDLLETTVRGLLQNDGAPIDGLIAELVIDGDEDNLLSQVVTADGAPVFEKVPLTLGDHVLTLRLLDGGTLISSAVRNINASIDTSDPECGAPPPAELMFITPTADAVLDAGDDANLADDLQVTVEVRASGDTPVSLSVNGEAAGEVVPADDVARFEGVTLPIGDGQGTASTLVATQGDATAEIAVSVTIDGCAITLTPEPIDGCWGAEQDADPDTDGVQVEFTAQTNCGAVTFEQNGNASDPVAVVDGVATATLTLDAGANAVRATASTDGGLTGEATGDYRAAGAEPTLDLAVEADAVFTLADAGDDGWQLSGTSDLPAETAVTVTFDPAQVEPINATTDADGNFTVAVDTEYACPVTVRALGTDACGGEGASEGYTVCFDGIAPVIEITAPDANAILVDGDAGQPGVQAAINVSIADARPGEIDYNVGIECAQGGDFVEVSVARRPRSAAEDGVLVIPVSVGLDNGLISCRAVADTVNNPAVTPATMFEVQTDLIGPTMTLVSPMANACVNDEVIAVTGTGAGLSDANAMATAVVTGDAELEQAMEAVGFDRFEGGVELPDGSYTVTARGDSDGGPITVEPADPIPFIVDRTAPVVGIVSPAAGAELGLADDANGDLSDCVQTRITVSLADANTDEICWTLNDGAETCAAVGPDGQATSDEVTLVDGANSLALRAVDCAGNETREVFNFSTTGCGVDPRELAITSPGDGELIRAAQDLDPDTDGCQFEIGAGGEGFEDGTEFIVCADSGDADPRCPGGGAVVSTAACASAGGVDQNLTCQISAPDGRHALTVVSTDANPFSSEPITLTVDCTPPSVTALSVVQDDASGCVNANEAGEADENGNYALTVQVNVDGIDDGDIVAVRALQQDDVLLNTGTVEGGVATVDVLLAEGDYVIYATATDSVGNPTPAADEALQVSFAVDVTAPTPELVGLVADACLNAGDDADGAADDLQYAFSISTGGTPDETLAARLLVDGEVAAELDDVGPALDFDAVTLAEGDHQVAIAITDACGNVGSVAGFDGDAPASFGVQVDTVAPAPTLSGVAEGQVLTFDDDVDMADGLQIALGVDFAAGTGPEAGQDIELLAGAGLLGSIAADGGDGPFNANVTLPSGASALTATARDACGNVGTSPVVNVTVDAGACASTITGFAANPAALGPADGTVDSDGLTVDLTAQVEAGCGGGTAELLVDGAVVANTNVGDGNLSFNDVTLASGERAVSLRVRAGAETADSPVQTIFVDLTAPSVVIDAPAGAEPVSIVDDADPDADGQQVLIAATITEDPVGTGRMARVEINGALAAGPVDVANESPAAIDFGAITVPAGVGELRICVVDMAGNEGCSTLAIDADGGAPGGIEPRATITDPRRPRVVLEFTAPGDDGEGGGRVSRLRVRRATSPIVTENDWAAATPVVTVGPTVDPGEVQRIVLDRLLEINTVHHIAVRAADDNGVEGAFTSIPVDLSLDTTTFDLDAPFNGDDFFNGGSLVVGVGDMDGDGLGDFLMYGNQIAGEAAAAVVFGGDGAAAEQVALTLDAGGSFQATDGGAVGDVNGDGRPDVALLGYTAAFDATRVAIYLGGDRDVAEPDAILTLPGRLTNFVTGVGNFNGAEFDDILIGGSPGGGGNTAFVVDGRANWPAELDASDPANGVTIIELPDDNAGVFGAGIGDLDGDGNADLALGAGGNFDMSYVFFGGADLPDTYAFDVNDDRTVALVNPCADPSTSFGSWFAGGVDFTGDGSPDFMVGARGHKAIAVFDQDLTAQRCVRRSEVQFGVNFDAAGDLNADGAIDLIATHRDDQGRPADALAFYNDGTGQFGGDGARTTADVRFTEADAVRLGAAGLGDFNGDGRDDVVIIHKVPGGPLRATVHY